MKTKTRPKRAKPNHVSSPAVTWGTYPFQPFSPLRASLRGGPDIARIYAPILRGLHQNAVKELRRLSKKSGYAKNIKSSLVKVIREIPDEAIKKAVDALIVELENGAKILS